MSGVDLENLTEAAPSSDELIALESSLEFDGVIVTSYGESPTDATEASQYADLFGGVNADPNRRRYGHWPVGVLLYMICMQ